jgi:hypothetical protein
MYQTVRSDNTEAIFRSIKVKRESERETYEAESSERSETRKVEPAS